MTDLEAILEAAQELPHLECPEDALTIGDFMRIIRAARARQEQSVASAGTPGLAQAGRAPESDAKGIAPREVTGSNPVAGNGPAGAAASIPCRIHEHDGAFKCYAHNKMWGAVSKPDEPCNQSKEVMPTGIVSDTPATSPAPAAVEGAGELKKAMEWLRSYGFNDPRRTHLCSRYVPTILSHIAGLEKQVKDLNDVEAAYQITVANLRALVNELEATQPMQWQPIETAPKGRKLILGYKNGAGMWRTIIGKYVLPGTLELTEEAIDRLNLDDGDDGTYAPEGWYETPDNAEFIDPTYETPIRWMPLPKEPK